MTTAADNAPVPSAFPLADKELRPIFGLVECTREVCGRRYALAFVLATQTTAVFAEADTKHLIAQVAGVPCCVGCGGELRTLMELAAQDSEGRWVPLNKSLSKSWRSN